MAFSDSGISLAFLGIGADKRRRRAGREARDVFKGATQEGIDMFNDMYEDDFNMIQSGIANFKDIANETALEASNPYLSSVEGRSFSNQIDENTDRSRQRFTNAASNMNLSDEAVVAGLNNINQAEGDSFRGLASNATQRQNQLRGQRMSALAQVLAGQNQLLGQRMNASNQGMNYGAGMAGNYNQGVQMEAQRQAANTQAFSNLLSGAISSLAGGGGG